MIWLEVPPHIHGPEVESAWWYVAGVVLLVAAIGIFVGLAIHRKRQLIAQSKVPSQCELMRSAALNELAELPDLMHAGQLSASQTVQRASQIVRRFIGTVANLNPDFLTLTELRKATLKLPFLQPLVEYVEQCYPLAFEPDNLPAEQAQQLAIELVDRGQEVIEQWQ